MKISKRLKTLGEMIDSKDIILDVGCDHALLDVFCIKEKKCKKAYASDNKSGPLEKAKENIEFYNLKEKIETILSDGIEVVPEDVNTIVISGMGGRSIEQILTSNKDNLKKVDYMCLSPNNEYERVRKTIMKIGYSIVEEIIIEDKKHFYLLVKTKKGKTNYSKKELKYGPILLRNKTKLFKGYLEKEKQKKQLIYKLTPRQYILKRLFLKKEIMEIANII